MALLRRRQVFDETLPDGTPAMDVGIPLWQRRLLRRQLAGDDPAVGTIDPPVVRTDAIPVTDTLPAPLQPSVGFSTPEAGYENRPVTLTRRAPTQLPPVDTTQIAPEVLTRTSPTLADKYLATATPYTMADQYLSRAVPATEPTVSVLPESERLAMGRLRRSLPDDPLIKASENAAYADSSRPDFGQDKFGNERTHAKRGFWGRLGAFGKALGQDVLEGHGLLSSLLDAGHAAANPDILAERRLKRVQAENNQQYANQVGIRKAATDIQSDEIRNAIGMDTLRGRPLERLQKQKDEEISRLLTMHDRAGSYDPNGTSPSDTMLRAEAERLGVPLVPYSKGDKAPPRMGVEGVTYERGTDGVWKPAQGLPVDRKDVVVPYTTAGGREVYVPQTTVASSDATAANAARQQSQWEYQVNAERAKAEAEARKVADNNARVKRNIDNMKTEQAKNEALAGDTRTKKVTYDGKEYEVPVVSDEERRAARAEADRIRREIRDEEGKYQQAAPYVPPPLLGTPRAAAPRLTEQQVRDAARANGLDPDTAVQRARARGQL